MYLHLGSDVVIPEKSVIAIFDMDNASFSHITRRFLDNAQKKSCVVTVGSDIPKSFILYEENGCEMVYISCISSQTLNKRAINTVNS